MEGNSTHVRSNNTPLWLNILVHGGAAVPLLILVVGALTGRLGFNPSQTALHLTGRAALVFLLLSLAVTPICQIFKLKGLSSIRRDLGLYAFKYALLHLLIYIVWDYRLDWTAIWQTFRQNHFIQIGLIAFFILLLLTLTSFNFWIAKLGKGWKYLHSLVYISAILIIIHFAWAGKGNILLLQGDVVEPLIAALVLVVLLMIRLFFALRR